MSDMLVIGDCCGCCVLSYLCFSMCSRLCIYIPWGKHKNSEDEAYAAEVERQMQIEKEREQRQPFTQSQPQALPNPNDKRTRK